MDRHLDFAVESRCWVERGVRRIDESAVAVALAVDGIFLSIKFHGMKITTLKLLLLSTALSTYISWCGISQNTVIMTLFEL